MDVCIVSGGDELMRTYHLFDASFYLYQLPCTIFNFETYLNNKRGANIMKIIALLGKTSSGKDTAARFIKSAYGIEPIISYSTRPQRIGETNHVEHHFVNDEEMDKIVADKESILAFVQFPKTGFRYCATTSDLEEDAIRTYIIDPSGLQWLKNNRPDVEVVSIFFDLDEEIIRKRAMLRGDKMEDIEKRLNSEREMFSNFAASGNYDSRINTNDAPDHINAKIMSVLDTML